IPLKIREKNNYYFSAYNEVFINTKSTLYDRNRLYGGVGYNINKGLRLELGYMNQFFKNGNRDQLSIFFIFLLVDNIIYVFNFYCF
ncbi:MAG: DUF2490 domain-containing protein, partial [Flavobacteriales bacterium]